MTYRVRRPWTGGLRHNGGMTTQGRTPARLIDAAVVALILVSTALLGPRPSGDPDHRGDRRHRTCRATGVAGLASAV